MKDVFIWNNNSQFRQVNVLNNGKNYSLDWHEHDFFHVNYITDGYVDILIRGNTFRVNKGELFIMPPYLKHRLESEFGYKQIGMDVHEEFDSFGLFKMMCDTFQNEFTVVKMAHILPQFEQAGIFNEQLSDLSKLRFFNFMENVLLEALKMQSSEDKFKRNVSQITDYSISVNELASKFYMSKSNLEREMRKAFGMSAKEFLDKNRMTSAYYLLLETDRKINDISAELGFCDTAHFITFFKKKEGITPLAFRKRERFN